MMKKKLIASLLTVTLLAASIVPAYGAEFTSEPVEAVFSAGEEVDAEESKECAQLTEMKWVKKPTEPFYYRDMSIPTPSEINGKYVVYGNGLSDGEVKLTYSDGYSEVVRINDLNRYEKSVKSFFYAPDKNRPKPGKYKTYVQVDGIDDIYVTTNVEVRSLDKLPVIKIKGSKIIPYSYDNPWIRLKTGSIKGHTITADVKANLEEPGVAFLVRKRGTMETQFMEDGDQILLEPNTEYIIWLSMVERGKKGSITYTVKPGRYDISKDRLLTAKLKSETAAYTGKPIKMGTTLGFWTRPLKLGKDYTVSYKNNVKMGSTATVILTGKGDFTGTIKKTFRIVPGKAVLQSAKRVGNTSAKLTWKNVKGATSYGVYRTDGKKWTKVATVKGTSFTDKGLRKGVGYKYKVRAYSKVGRKNIYGSYSSVKTIK